MKLEEVKRKLEQMFDKLELYSDQRGHKELYDKLEDMYLDVCMKIEEIREKSCKVF